MPDQPTKLSFYSNVNLNSKAMLLKFLNDSSLARASRRITLKKTSDYKMINPHQRTPWNGQKSKSSIRLKQIPLLTCIDSEVLSTTAFFFSHVCMRVSCFKNGEEVLVNHKFTISQQADISA